MIEAFEINFDGLVGPTHNYSGLSYGNVASTTHRGAVANPREAALQGLAKMKFLTDLGFRQAVLPPQERPALWVLRSLGLTGSDAQVLAAGAKQAPEILAACASASSMWTANAATVAPSADTLDGKVHLTPANLASKFHRSIEPAQTARALRAIFPDPARFAHHDPLLPGDFLGDEGAANHTRFCEHYGEPGLELFVYGRRAFSPTPSAPTRFPARQTREASEAIARLHGLKSGQSLFFQQNPAAIDEGVFHNDVVSVGNGNFFFCHEAAFLDQPKALSELRTRYLALTGHELTIHEVKAKDVSLPDAVKSYLFNCQILSLPSGGRVLIVPSECREIPSVHRYLDALQASSSNPFAQIHFLDLRQSMRNGGGPACLRLRIVLTAEEIRASNSAVYLDDALHAKLTSWVKKHYRDRLDPADLADPKLLEESRMALDELTQILKLGSIYPFQMAD